MEFTFEEIENDILELHKKVGKLVQEFPDNRKLEDLRFFSFIFISFELS